MKPGMTANDNGYEYTELERERIWVICEDCELLRSFDGNAVKAEFIAAPAPSPLRMIAQRLIGCPKSKEDFGPRCRLSYYWTFDHPKISDAFIEWVFCTSPDDALTEWKRKVRWPLIETSRGPVEIIGEAHT